MDQFIFASLSHTHYWYEVGMLKVPTYYLQLILFLIGPIDLLISRTVSQDQILRCEREQVNVHLPCSADLEQYW